MGVRKLLASLLAAAIGMPLLALVAPSTAAATITPFASETTYKEYWVPHTQFSGGCSSPVLTGGYFYVEPAPCAKTLTFSIPDNAAGALRAEIYLDLWRNRDVPKLRFRLNGGILRDPGVGAEWGRTPYVGDIPLTDLRQGANTIEFSAAAPVHVHDIAIRVFYDTTHPLVAGPGSDVTPPTGNLASIVASNGTFAPSAGGTLNVDNDQLTFTATASGAKYVEFIGYYDGYDIDADGVSTEWQATGRNNWFPGGRNVQASGGLINHLGSDATSPYQVTWQLPHVRNQSGVKFKVRIVDTAGNVREAAGGESAPFTLSRTDSVEYYTIPGFQDAVLHHDGLFPDELTRSITLPDMTGVVSAQLLGNYWNNPVIQINGNTTLYRAFPSGADQWKLSNVTIPVNLLGSGANTIKYSYSGNGFGEFIERPGPMIVLRRHIASPIPPTITSQPSSVTVSDGTPTTLRVTANGSPLLTYQWFRDGQPIAGATSTTYTTPRLSNADAGAIYTVTVSSRYGVATSNPMPVIVRGMGPWWDNLWPYRFEVNVGGGGVTRTDKIVDVSVNFTEYLDSIGQSGRFDPDTIRVIEVDDTGAVIDNDIRYQFDGVTGYNADTNARGTLVFEMAGTTAANATRRFHVYFAKTGSGIGPFVQTFPLSVVDNVFDEGQNSFRITTPTSTWYYHKQGAGFSSLIDVAGREWLGYRPDVAGSGGTFRGTPNAIFPDGQFHPGAVGSTTILQSQGPLKATLRSTTLDNQWVIQWDIYLTYAKATVLRAPRAYWFLFEGTPGGSLSYTNDIVIRSNGVQNTAGQSWQEDIVGDEWVVIGDAPQGRSVFVAQHNPDNAIDSYRPMEGNMTVLGFGRRTNDPQLRATPNSFSVGLIDTTSYAVAKPIIEDRYKPLDISSSFAEAQAGPVLPGAPTAVTATALDASAEVSWTAPIVTGGNPILNYVITPTPGSPVTVAGDVTTATVPGLANGVAHTFVVRAVTEVGPGPDSDPSLPITPSPNLGLVSDDFNSRTLRSDWALTDPRLDAEVMLTGEELILRVPGGVTHDLWTNALEAPQLLQSVADVDFQTVLKYENAPDKVFQMQGFVAKEDDENFARFDLLYAPASGFPGGVLKVTGSSIINGVGELQLEALVPAANVRYLRVTRTGADWQLEYSVDGTAWLSAGHFEQAMSVTHVGVFAGNFNPVAADTPQFISRLDYVFNTAYPIVPEDAVPDTAPVVLSEVVGSPSETRFAVALRTDQLATAIVDFGLTPAYELGSTTATSLDTRHRAVVGGLQPNTQYFYRIRVADLRGTTAELDGQTITTLQPGVGTSTVDLWYGFRQFFGFNGQPQRWVNILGNVSDLDGIGDASFSLNGGAAEFLQIGKDDRRLANMGDFNVQIAATRLLRGLNTLTITFTDLYGEVVTQNVEIMGEQGRTWPMPYNVKWADVTNVQDVSQIVDGKWTLENGGIRTVEIGYDRLIAVGDMSWTDYELTVPITPHSKDDAGYAFPSSGPAIGLLMRWTGHYDVDGRQPSWGYAPLGALGWYRFQTNNTEKLVISDGQGLNAVSGPQTFQLQFGTTYIFKMRVQTIPTGANPGHLYTLSVWQQGQPEQSGVTISTLQPMSGIQSGSALLVAHHVDATFGDISVVRINAATTPTISPAGGIYTTGQTVSITSPDPAGVIHYTVDGSEPTTSSKVYTGPFVLNTDATVKAITVRENLDTSGVVSESFFIRKTTPIRSDAFSTGALDTSVWTLLDARNDALPFFSKTATDARFNVFVPGGTSHDLFDTRLLAPRLLQSAPNSDFDIRAKYQGTYSGTFTMQGLIAQQTYKDFVRVDVYRNGTTRHIYAATFVNGVATTRLDAVVPIGTNSSPNVFMRLQRVGNEFTVYWSSDGITWNSAGSFAHPIVVSAVGAWVGSHSGTGTTSQAMTGVLDWFENAAAPLVNEDAVLPANLAPALNAGPDLTSQVGIAPSLVVRANVADDSLPHTALTYTWSKITGPGTPIFGVTGFEATTLVKAGVAFDIAGVYELQLCASDGSLTTCDQFRVTVAPAPGAPIVDAGRSTRVTTTSNVRLLGSVADDGLPNPLQITWTLESGPTGATILSPNTAETEASFTQRGTYVFRLTATDGQFTTSDLVEIVVVDPRSEDGLLALWDFADGSGDVIHDVSGVGTALDLHISTPSRVAWGSGLTVNDIVEIASHEPAAKIAAPIANSGEYTVEAWVRPANLTQFGPARIVSLSSSSTQRDVTLGQGGADFQTGDHVDLRTRSTGTSANGTPSLVANDGLTLGLNHIVATRDAAGVTTIWINGVAQATGTASGSLSGWDTTMPFVLANEFGGGRPWLGEYRLVAVYDRAFTAGEVASQYQHGPTVIAPNLAPEIDAGPDQSIIHPLVVNLAGTATDDGRPSRTAVLTEWTKTSGPGIVTFGNPNLLNTTVSFSMPGVYELTLSGEDGELTGTDVVVITVLPQPPNVAPVVTLGADTTAVLGTPLPLTGTVVDDGLPIPPAAYTVQWSQTTGPGTATFTAGTAETTNVSFTAKGLYTLRLTADDGADTAFDEIVVDVRTPNRIDTGVVGMWTFSDGSGTVVHDVSGFGTPLDLTITEPGKVAWTADGLQINANTMIRSVGNATKITNAIKTSNAYTVEFWVDPNEVSPASQGRIVSIAGNANSWNVAAGQGFYDGYATNLYRARTGTTNTAQPFSVADVPNAELTHVVITRRADGQQKIFVNGVERHSVNTLGNLSNWQDYPMYLANESGLNRPWRGTYRMVTFFDRQLSVAEVTQNFLAGGIVNSRPTVNVGPDATVQTGVARSFVATATDDGLPDPPAALTQQWRLVSGPAAPVFSAPTSTTTNITFPVAGTYVVALDANDGALVGTDTVTVLVADNTAPTVSAGADATVEHGLPIPLTGTMSDDGFPASGTLTSTWSQVSGPGSSTFGNANALTTTATVTLPGTYVFRLTANDGALSSSDTVTVIAAVNTAPTVSAGADASVAVNRTISLVGDVSDDGLPTGGTVAIAWSTASGPGTVTFVPSDSAASTASFSATGTYVLRLTASDGSLSTDDTVTINVTPAVTPSAPVVTPAGGAYVQSVVVSAQPALVGGVVRYTLDGNDPTETSPVLNGSVVLTSSATFKAREFSPNDPPSFIATEVYTITASSRVGSNLVSLYRFDEGVGTVVRDVSGVGTPVDLTLNTPANSVWTSGKLTVSGGAAAVSTGAATKINTAIKTSNQLTVEAWVTAASASAVTPSTPGHIVNLASSQNSRNVQLSQGFFSTSPANVWDARLRTTTSNTNNGTSGTTKVQTALTHVVYTRATNGAVRLYVNGTQVYSGGAGGDLSNWDTAMPLLLGNRPEGGGGWNGSYHLVAFYDRALTLAEVGQNFAAGSEG